MMTIAKLVTPDLIEIPLTARGGSLLIPRYAYFNPMSKRNYSREGIQGLRLNQREVDAVEPLFRGFDREDRFVWLEPKPAPGTCYKIDMSRLTMDELRQPEWTTDVIYRGDILSAAIVGVMSPPTINEGKADDHFDEIADMLRRDCSEFLSQWDHDHPLFAGLRTMGGVTRLFPDTSKFMFVTIPEKIDPRDAHITSKTFATVINHAMTKSGIKATRLNSVSTSGNLDLVALDGGVYAIFPVDGFAFSWSSEVGDFVHHFANSTFYHSTAYPKSKFGGQMRIIDYWKSIETTYRSDDINAAIKSGNEILIHAEGFYAVNARTFAEMVKKGFEI